MKKVFPDVLLKMQNVLIVICWYKKDLRRFIANIIRDSIMLVTQDWDNTPKYNLVQILIQRIARNEIKYRKDLLVPNFVVAFFVFSYLKILSK